MKTVRSKMLSPILLSIAVLNVPLVAQDLQSGLVASYPFTGNARDASGLGNHGNVLGAQLAEDRLGEATNAFYFDGDGSRIVVTSSPSLNIQGAAVTIAAWIAPTQLTGEGERRTIVRKMAVSGGEGGYLFALSRQGHPQFGFRAQSPDFYSRQATNFAIPLDMWTHTAVSYDGTNARFYLNGVETEALSLAGAIGVNDDPLVIGAAANTNLDNFVGYLDEVTIFGRTFTAEEVQALYAVQTNDPPRAIIQVTPVRSLPGYTNKFVFSPSGRGANVRLVAVGRNNAGAKYEWSEHDRVFSTGRVAVRKLTPGRHEITLTVRDGALEQSETVVLDVISGRDAMSILADLVNQADLSPIQRRNLIANLRLYAASLQGNRLYYRHSQLALFQRRVEHYLGARQPELAEHLRAIAAEIDKAVRGL